MPMEIKAIETEYNGYRFRSRLEARWAVFFDVANISYKYETEGYVLQDGTKYLPDFYLPDFDLFVEIKPYDTSIVSYPGAGNEWERKCRMFRNSTDRAILICYGCPADDIPKYLFAFDTCDSGGGIYEGQANFVEYKKRIVLCTEPERMDRTIYTRQWDTNENIDTPGGFTGERNFFWNLACLPYSWSGKDILNKAKTASRQARFEHGESGYKKKKEKSSMCKVNEMIWSAPCKRKRGSATADVLISITKSHSTRPRYDNVLRISFSAEAIKRIRQKNETRLRIGYHPNFRNRIYFQATEDSTGYKIQNKRGTRSVVTIPINALAGMDLEKLFPEKKEYCMEKDKDNMPFIAINQ